MKAVLVAVLLTITLPSGVLAKGRSGKDKSIVAYAHDKVFGFRVKGRLMGGVVEVYDANKKLLGLEELTQREMRIDFTELPHGSYIIKIRILQNVTEFSYNNSTGEMRG